MHHRTQKQIALFRRCVYEFYRHHRRNFPWRRSLTPYRVVVSEIMLQQTQVQRVIEPFTRWIKTFPTFRSLAQSPLRRAVAAWQGLGYNRRALALHRIAVLVVSDHANRLPRSPDILSSFPGIGRATAASICAFAFNQPTVFVETNIRTVYIHHFFPGTDPVHDRDIELLVDATLDRENPRQWYSALMDYGTFLKQDHPHPHRRSAHYTRQTPFKGSNRQIRGAVVRLLSRHKRATIDALCTAASVSPQRMRPLLEQLITEGFVVQDKAGHYWLRA